MALKICFLSMLHRHDDVRVFHKEACSLAHVGFDVVHLAPGKVADGYKNGVCIKIYHSEERKGLWGRLVKTIPLYRSAVAVDADVYHCNELESWLVGCLIKLLHRKKLIVFDVHEHYPSRFYHPLFPRWLGGIGEQVTRYLYRVLYPLTDHLVLVNADFAADFPKIPAKQTVVFNYVTLEKEILDRDSWVTPPLLEGFAERCIAIHTGGLTKVRGWPELLQALKLTHNHNVHFLSLGNVTEGNDLFLEEARRNGVEKRVHILAPVPYLEMFNYLAAAHVGLILYQPGLRNHELSLPIKLSDYMLVGLPVLAPKFAPEIRAIVEAEQCGLLVDPSNPMEIAHALDWLSTHPVEAHAMGQRGRAAVLRKYNWNHEAAKLIDLYNSFANNLNRHGD